MTTGDFDNYYGQEPFSGLGTLQREVYDPNLRDSWLANATWANYVSVQHNLGAVNAPSMTITSLSHPHINTDAIAVRQLWMDTSYIDTYARTITFQRNGAVLNLHEYDEIVNYLKLDRNGGLRRIIDLEMGRIVVGVNNLLARNAFLSAPYKLIGAAGSLTGFDQLQTTDLMNSDIIEDIRQGMKEAGVPFTLAKALGTPAAICITTPGVTRSIRDSGTTTGEWLDVIKYADPMRAVTGEVGSWRGVRFVEDNNACLYNCGVITTQKSIAGALYANDGSPAPTSPVDGVYKVGQSSGVVNYIQLEDFDEGDFVVGDLVAIHKTLTDAYGVTNGVDFKEGSLEYRRIVSVNATTNRIAVDEPIKENFSTELDTGIYGYVTKAKHVHSATFIGGTDGVVLGVARPPRLHTPPAVDSFESMYRVSFDQYMGYQVFEPKSYRVWFGAAPNALLGASYI